MPRVRVGDVDLYYREAGSGAPLLLVHGLGGSSLDWEHQLAYFAARYRVLAPDLRGFGDSARGRGALSVRAHVADIAGFLDAMKVTRCRLIGHSMGGAVAQQFALEQPQRVERMVIANSVPSFRPRSPRHHLEFLYRLVVMAVLGPARLAEIGARRSFPDPAQAAQRARAVARGARNSRRNYLAALQALSTWSVIERLDELQMPVLVAASEHDYFGHDETVMFAHALPRARLHLFKGAHHGLPGEQPAAFNAVVERFFDAPPPARRKATA
ncbi:alpha/beta fold hydrolase [Sinimarinibacterium flocculans]|uniref:Pimeloyl-ACP methyl ester carboxylesterase n=1 Tax=Sinimarinibacterium flocculans TaxID=985250 RepID=A0A318EID2_9GAMM|nr:alpha/beta hydrolase [Sinimarinibacterium flocculans]PXV68484.1 pimeloyl-ACP methyl ester carboxylesterase [Sinimarinibacterium flocculans]